MTREQVVDLYFMEARAKLVDIAAFLDRAQRAKGGNDFRLKALVRAADELHSRTPGRARRVLMHLSDPTTKPVKAAPEKAAHGGWAGGK